MYNHIKLCIYIHTYIHTYIQSMNQSMNQSINQSINQSTIYIYNHQIHIIKYIYT